MGLTALTVLNIPGVTQTIQFSNPTQIDEIDFGSNQVTFKTMSSFSLSKADFMIYFNYLDVYTTALYLNFPSINDSNALQLPASEYDFKIGGTRITYVQQSAANTVLDLTYLFSNSTMTFATRAADRIVSLQEYFEMIYQLRHVTRQVSLH